MTGITTITDGLEASMLGNVPVSYTSSLYYLRNELILACYYLNSLKQQETLNFAIFLSVCSES